MLEEALVFGRENGLHQHFGNVVEMHDAALLAVAVREVGDELRLDLELSAWRAVGSRDDAGNFTVRKLDHAAFRLHRIRPGDYLHRIRPKVIPTHAVRAGFAIARAPQQVHQIGR